MGRWVIRLPGVGPGRRVDSSSAVAFLLGICLLLGCATPEERYHTLSIFFDGVPLPESMRPPEPEREDLPERVFDDKQFRATVEWVIHEPDCDECHTADKTGITYLDPPDLCWECHDEEDYVGEVPHGPFAAGACTQCHTPHKSQNESLLLTALPDLCAECHDETTYPELESHKEQQGEDCIDCHNPHAGASEYMLDARWTPPSMRSDWLLAHEIGVAR